MRVVEGDAASARERVVAALCAEARARGEAEGREAGRDTAARALAQAVERLEAFQDQAHDSLARTAAELGIEVARHLVAREVEAGRHDVERIVRETLRESGVGRGPCVVHLHPEDAASLEHVPFRAGTRLESDLTVGRGEVQVETPSGLFVRDLKDAIQAIGQRILESLR